MIVELKKGLVRWYYVLKSANGEILSTSQKYFSKSNAMRAVRRLATIVNAKVKIPKS